MSLPGGGRFARRAPSFVSGDSQTNWAYPSRSSRSGGLDIEHPLTRHEPIPSDRQAAQHDRGAEHEVPCQRLSEDDQAEGNGDDRKQVGHARGRGRPPVLDEAVVEDVGEARLEDFWGQTLARTVRERSTGWVG